MRFLGSTVMLLLVLGVCRAQGEGVPWIVLVGEGATNVWKGKVKGWTEVGEVEVDPKAPRRLTARAGKGVFFNGTKGHAGNLVTKQSFGDVEIELEFFIP